MFPRIVGLVCHDVLVSLVKGEDVTIMRYVRPLVYAVVFCIMRGSRSLYIEMADPV